jgi:hypothetical protein
VRFLEAVRIRVHRLVSIAARSRMTRNMVSTLAPIAALA